MPTLEDEQLEESGSFLTNTKFSSEVFSLNLTQVLADISCQAVKIFSISHSAKDCTKS